MAASGIYSIEHRESGKKYIGSAVDLVQRWRCHRSNLNASRHHSKKLQNAWDKHGPEAFVFSIIEITEKDALVEREQYWIDGTRSATAAGYNILPRAGSQLGKRLSAETKAKISAALKGRRLSDERRAEVTVVLQRSWHRERPAEETERRSAAATGKKLDEAAREKIRRAATGRKASAATRAKLTAQRMGRKQHPVTAAALLRAHTGAKRSDETKRNISLALKKLWASNPPWKRDALGRITCSFDAALRATPRPPGSCPRARSRSEPAWWSA